MRRGEKGFFLIEVMIVIAITATIMGVVTMTTIALITNPLRSTNQNIVLNDAQNTGYRISRDVKMAKTVTLGEPRGFPLILVIPVDMNPDNDYSVSYFFDGTNLKRQVNGSPGTSVAQYIDVENTTFSPVYSNTYNLTVTASKDAATVERSYEVSQRLSTE